MGCGVVGMTTQTIKPEEICEKWFVYDDENNMQIFSTEKSAYEEFLKIIEEYRESACGDEWADEVENVTWGKIYQTVELQEIELLPDEDYSYDEGDVADAFIIEHRRE
jgi:hypothetical protein